MEITVDNRELVALERRLALAGKATPQNIGRVLKTIGVIVKGKAVAFAPRSMTKAEYVKTLKGHNYGASQSIDFNLMKQTGFVQGGKLKGVKTKRSTDSFHPGQLKRSITSEVFSDRVEIGVPSNSPAGEYAEKVHETWKRPERQPHNDAQATKEFIFEAQKATEADYMRAVDALVDKIIKAI